jgi:hypothetical protein
MTARPVDLDGGVPAGVAARASRAPSGRASTSVPGSAGRIRGGAGAATGSVARADGPAAVGAGCVASGRFSSMSPRRRDAPVAGTVAPSLSAAGRSAGSISRSSSRARDMTAAGGGATGRSTGPGPSDREARRGRSGSSAAAGGGAGAGVPVCPSRTAGARERDSVASRLRLSNHSSPTHPSAAPPSSAASDSSTTTTGCGHARCRRPSLEARTRSAHASRSGSASAASRGRRFQRSDSRSWLTETGFGRPASGCRLRLQSIVTNPVRGCRPSQPPEARG